MTDSTLLSITKYAPLFAFGFVQLSGIGPIYQIIKTKKTENVSPMPFLALIVSCILWGYYAHLVQDLVIFIANVSGIICGSSYFALFCMYTSVTLRKHYTNILLLLLSCSFAFLTVFPIFFDEKDMKMYVAFAGCILSIFMMSSPLVSMKTVMTERNTSSMSLIVSIAMTANGLTWAMYGMIIMHGNLFIVIPNVIGVVAGCVQLSLFCIYPSSKQYEAIPI